MPSHADRAMGTRGNGAVAANGSDIDTFGEKSLHLLIHGRSYRWTFVVAAPEFLHHLCRPTSPQQEIPHKKVPAGRLNQPTAVLGEELNPDSTGTDTNHSTIIH
ncbi:uncharacterized protein KZ484_004332 [Pholidichthys leucotaenia]